MVAACSYDWMYSTLSLPPAAFRGREMEKLKNRKFKWHKAIKGLEYEMGDMR